MTRYVALLRGVNVGAHRRIAMADLRSLLTGLGYTAVATYLQSGNAVLDAEGTGPDAVAAAIRGAVLDGLGHDVPVVVRTAERWRAAVAANPLEVPDPSRFLVLFSSQAWDTEALGAVDLSAHPHERLAFTGTEVYTGHRDGVRFAALPDTVAGCTTGAVTARNWRTVVRLLEMVQR
ncbi:DUF1697 domain-containing protein [Nocardiopsis sp. LOL_012]|uniref:DUF1697 domain-containing protein n=1 Tax=Nocardiopsis sp. LOL_012 TaxID=3345409 RepID=UPI003A865B17